MASAGIVRRIDELGRIVIPKEIRKTLRMKNGDSLEITLEEENIVLKKYSSMNGLDTLSQIFASTISSKYPYNILVCDTNEYLAFSSSFKKKYEKKPISIEMIKLLDTRTLLKKRDLELIDGVIEQGYFLLSPVLVNGDVEGLVLFQKQEPFLKEEETIIQITSQILSKSLEE